MGATIASNTSVVDPGIAGKGYVHPEVLVTTGWLAEHLDDPNIRIIKSVADILPNYPVELLVLRKDMLDRVRSADVGLSLLPMRPDDPSIVELLGASNKSFEYLACGLVLLVTDLPSWRRLSWMVRESRWYDPAGAKRLQLSCLHVGRRRYAA